MSCDGVTGIAVWRRKHCQSQNQWSRHPTTYKSVYSHSLLAEGHGLLIICDLVMTDLIKKQHTVKLDGFTLGKIEMGLLQPSVGLEE